MKLVVAGILLACATTAMAKGRAITDDDIKSCLAEIYTKQTLFQNEHGKFAKNAKELSVQKSDICKGIKLKFKKVDASSFVVHAKAGKKLWSVDDTKTMQKIK